jgi:hypothetical protein
LEGSYDVKWIVEGPVPLSDENTTRIVLSKFITQDREAMAVLSRAVADYLSRADKAREAEKPLQGDS